MKTLAAVLFLTVPCLAGITVGQKLPVVSVTDKGLMIPHVKVVGGALVLDGQDLSYRPWKSTDQDGRVRTIYHLAARVGMDDVNKAYIDALIAANLPERAPDGAYKTVTILNLADALWGTHALGLNSLEKNQRKTPYAFFVADEKGAAREAWGLKPKASAVIILDRDGTVLFFKEGQLSPEEISRAVALIRDRVKQDPK
jgi:hypothetical protein